MISHLNSGNCPKCVELFDKYPGFYEPLRTWFSAIQIENTEAHISCAGRGKDDQNVLFARGASRARYGWSSHNWNCAVDLFELRNGIYTLDPLWFQKVIKPNLYSDLEWYGEPDAEFHELPHVELASWMNSKKLRHLSLVE